MHDQLEPTEEEQAQVPERLQEEEAMRYPAHDDPHDLIDPGAVEAEGGGPVRREDDG